MIRKIQKAIWPRLFREPQAPSTRNSRQEVPKEPRTPMYQTLEKLPYPKKGQASKALKKRKIRKAIYIKPILSLNKAVKSHTLCQAHCDYRCSYISAPAADMKKHHYHPYDAGDKIIG